MRKAIFEEWKKDLDQRFCKKHPGLISLDDLPYQPYRDWFLAEMSPAWAVFEIERSTQLSEDEPYGYVDGTALCGQSLAILCAPKHINPEQLSMFDDGSELPLFSGTAQRATINPFKPQVTGHQEKF